MGRGKGGSSSHEKRTPGGIRTSSKMSADRFEAMQSRSLLQEEEQRRAEAGLIHNKVQEAMETRAAESGETVEEMMKDPSWQRYSRALEQDIRDYIKGGGEKPGAGVLSAGQKERLSDPVAYGQSLMYENLTLPSERTRDEIDKRFDKEMSKLGWTADEDDLNKDNPNSEEMMYISGGFLGRVADRARKDPNMRELFLKLRAYAGLVDGGGTLRNMSNELERNVALHLMHLVEHGKPLEEDVNNLNLDADDPLNMVDDSIANTYYYKALLSNPETRGMLQKAVADQSFAFATPISAYKTWRRNFPTVSGAKEQTTQALREHAKPVHRMGLEDIDKLRAVFGEKRVEMPEYVQKATEGQPASSRIYSLIKPDMTEDGMAEVFSPGTMLVAEYADLFDESSYSMNQDIPELSDLEKYVLVGYTGNMYQRVNGYIRQVVSLLNNYQTTEDSDIKKNMEKQFEVLMTDPFHMETRVISSLVMDALAKVMMGNKGEVRSVTRGSSQTPIPLEGLEAGKIFYDPAVKSATLRRNWASPWGFNNTQYVLTTDKYVDARPYSLMQEENQWDDSVAAEDEMIIYPGVMFQADLVDHYKVAHDTPADIRAANIVAGRQVTFDEKGNKKLLDTSGKKRTGVNRSLLLGDKRLEGGKAKLKDYEARFDSSGRSLYHWLYDRRK